MAIQFPDGAPDGDTVDPGNGITYTYNQAKDKWTGAITSGGGSGGGSSSIIVSETTPTGSSEGDMWFKPSIGTLHVYVSNAWTIAGVPMDTWTDIPAAQ